MPSPTQFNSHEEYLQWYRDYREKNRKKFRVYGREYNRKYRQKHGYGNERAWTINNRQKRRVENILQYAVKTGKIKRLGCEVCKKNKAHGHHNDYNEPLEVIWLCHKHHKWIHANFTPEELKTIHEPELLLNFLRELDKVKN